MRILWLATKIPWPPDDGGKLLILETLRAFGARHEVTLVAPGTSIPAALAELCAVEAVPAPRGAFVSTLVRGVPLSMARHARPALAARVAALASSGRFDLVHVEQLQALLGAPVSNGLPVVLRAQNVESDLWHAAARVAGAAARLPMAWEARRLARWEGRALALADVTVALTPGDRDRLRALSGLPADRVVHAPVPFSSRLPSPGVPLEGSPAAVLFGSAGWHPNDDGRRWFLRHVWPCVARALPGAVLHVFGEAEPGERVRSHPRPDDAATGFARGSVLVVPLRYGSGVRMKVLEAWARGVPVVATPEAMNGLVAKAGEDHLAASDGAQFTAALSRLVAEPALAEALAAAGRRRLETEYHPARAADALTAAYESAVERASARRARV